MARFIWTIRVEYMGKAAFHSPKVGEIRYGNSLQSGNYGQLLVTAAAPRLCDNLPHGLSRSLAPSPTAICLPRVDCRANSPCTDILHECADRLEYAQEFTIKAWKNPGCVVPSPESVR